MRSEKQLQCIQCSGSSFSLDIFGFPSFSYVHDAHPYHWSFMEGYCDICSTHLSWDLSCPRRYSSSDHPPTCIMLFKSWVWTTHCQLFVLGLLMLSANAGLIHILGLRPHSNLVYLHGYTVIFRVGCVNLLLTLLYIN